MQTMRPTTGTAGRKTKFNQPAADIAKAGALAQADSLGAHWTVGETTEKAGL